MIKMKERYEVLLKLEKSLEGTKMKPKGEIDVENGLLTYRGVPAIIVSRTTQGMLIREMYNLAGRGILMAFRRCGLEGGRGVYKYLLEFSEIDEENIFDNFYKLEEDDVKLCSAKGDPYCEFHIEKQ